MTLTAKEKSRYLDGAAKALERAQKAMWAAGNFHLAHDCKIQEAAALAEVNCALELIAKVKGENPVSNDQPINFPVGNYVISLLKEQKSLPIGNGVTLLAAGDLLAGTLPIKD